MACPVDINELKDENNMTITNEKITRATITSTKVNPPSLCLNFGNIPECSNMIGPVSRLPCYCQINFFQYTDLVGQIRHDIREVGVYIRHLTMPGIPFKCLVKLAFQLWIIYGKLDLGKGLGGMIAGGCLEIIGPGKIDGSGLHPKQCHHNGCNNGHGHDHLDQGKTGLPLTAAGTPGSIICSHHRRHIGRSGELSFGTCGVEWSFPGYLPGHESGPDLNTLC